MGSIEANLMPGEEITYRTHLHWVIYTVTIIIGACALALLIGSLGYGSWLPLASRA